MYNAISAAYEIGCNRRAAREEAKGQTPAIAIIKGMPLEQLPDEELVVGYRAATDAASREEYVNELFRRNYSKVGRWCLRFTSNRESAADLAQEVFTKAYQNLASFQGQSKFSTWLFVIARNHCLNASRANARQATELKAEVDENFLSEIPDLADNPHDAVERSRAATLARELLGEALDDTEKTVFSLHYGEEVSLDAITSMLGLTNQSGAKAYIVSARRKLARLVQLRKARGQQIGTV